ncbi:hypothetical protein KQI61_07690 [Anaerocolumna aminovalerica]|uniref:hypothetical protein n=1 Tax=Anaerocolumna aminovalerica TaxID=1527 RepID=UPI001C0E99A3|nr:hypothetical protein [Anaerocolumna aminovalerica]MBU5332078.1 hypothetical protein [Anaerocolumna aminovalerica]
MKRIFEVEPLLNDDNMIRFFKSQNEVDTFLNENKGVFIVSEHDICNEMYNDIFH